MTPPPLASLPQGSRQHGHTPPIDGRATLPRNNSSHRGGHNPHIGRRSSTPQQQQRHPSIDSSHESLLDRRDGVVAAPTPIHVQRSTSDTPRYSPHDLDRRLRTTERRRGSPRIGVGFDFGDGPRLQPHSRTRTPVSGLRREEVVPMSWAAIAAGASLRSERRVSVAASWEVEHLRVSPRGQMTPTRSPTPSPGDTGIVTSGAHSPFVAFSEQDEEEPLSQAPSVIFDSPPLDTDKFSDFATDVSASSLSESGLPPELQQDDALLNPHKYYLEIADLEATVAGNSSLFLMKERNRTRYPRAAPQFDLRFSYAQLSATLPSYDEPILRFIEEHKNSNHAVYAFHLLECRNLMLAIVANIRRMQQARFCGDVFSLITLDHARPAIAELVPIRIDAILQLHQDWEQATKMAANWSLAGTSSIDPVKATAHLTQQCSDFMTSFKLPPAQSAIGTWRKVLQVIDLAMVSYCGAHMERFDQKYIHEDLDLAKLTCAWTHDETCREGIMLRRRRLRCLNEFFHGVPVWVFQSQSQWEDNQPLYLRASVEDFADIWGPVWAVKSNACAEDQLLHFNCGGGSIVAMPRDHAPPDAEESEILCHWIDDEPDEAPTPFTLSPGSRLLIGGGAFDSKTSYLRENESCTNNTSRTKQYLQSTNALEDLGTRKAERYLSEDQYNVQIGYGGVALGTQRTYKKRQQITLKEAICEAWRNGGGDRNPALLEQWLGVEVSFCTRNARRRRLKDIFNTRSMRNWLEKSMTREKSAAEQAFNEAISSSDPQAFARLYKENRHLRQDLGHIVSACLEGLKHSNVDNDGVLRALWVPRDDEPAYRVKLKLNPHSWTAMLRDTEDTASFTVISNRCLTAGVEYRHASVCSESLSTTNSLQRIPTNASALTIPAGTHVGNTIFETAVVVNEHPSAVKPKGLKRRESELVNASFSSNSTSTTVSGEKTNRHFPQGRWSVTSIPRGERFLLPHGRLKVLEPLSNTVFTLPHTPTSATGAGIADRPPPSYAAAMGTPTNNASRDRILAVQWESGMQKQLHLAKQSVVRTVGKESLYHWELKAEEPGWPTRPIKVWVVSQYEHKR